MTSDRRVELTTTGWATGGDAVARGDDGRVVFVSGAVAGERLVAELVDERRSFARARVVEVLDAGPGRVEPTCGEVARGCGGCDLAHVSADAQEQAKRSMVLDALGRLGGVEVDPAEVHVGPPLATTGFRTTVRAAVVHGRAGLRRRASHESVDVASCAVAHPLVEELLVEGRYPGADEVTIRVGARTGERLVVVGPSATDVLVPSGVVVVGTDQLAAGRRAWIHEEVAGHRFRISAGSFFQTRPDGAEALVALAAAGVGDAERLVDLCSGVGLFAATVAADRTVAVESNRSAVADARVNLAERADVRIVRSRFESWRPSPADAVIADPARAGLGRAGVSVVAATGAGRVVLVSCDVGSLGRDVGLFADAGYHVAEVTLVDLFPDTSHVEVVTLLDRSDGG